MSDFFTRLAERTLGLAPTIQPITPSLFAPAPDLPSDMLLEITEESEGSKKSAVADNFSENAESPVLSQDTATPLTYLAHPPSLQLQHEVSQPFSTTSSTSSATALRQQPALTTMTERQSTRMPDRLTTRSETSTTHPGVQPMRHGSQHTQTVTPASSSYAQSSSFAPMNVQTLRMAQRTDEIAETGATFPASSVTDNSFTHGTHIFTVPANSEQQMAEAQQTTQAATQHEQIVSHHTLLGIPASNPLSTTGFSQTQQTQQAQSSQLEIPSPEPAIQVTIGRVEVRAVTTSPTSARTQQQSNRPPAMSLDEYLRQQERGGRR